MKNPNKLIIASVVLLLLIIIVNYTNKSSFGQSQNVNINFLGSKYKDDNGYDITYDEGRSYEMNPTINSNLTLLHTDQAGNEIDKTIISNSYLYSIVGDNSSDWNYHIKYSPISPNSTINVNDGDFLFTTDVLGGTSYKISFGQLDPSKGGVSIDSNNLITIDPTFSGPLNIPYIHNTQNNTRPPNSILITFPDSSTAFKTWLGNVNLGFQGNPPSIIFSTDHSGPVGQNIIILDGQNGFTMNNPNIYLNLKYVVNNIVLPFAKEGRTGDASSFINDRIRKGFRTFYVQTQDGPYCVLTTVDKWGAGITATDNITPGVKNDWSGKITELRC